MAAGEAQQAFKWFDRAARLAPNSAAVSFLVGVALAKTDLAASLARFEALVCEWPDFCAGYFTLAGALLWAKGAEAAASKLSEALHRFALPRDPDHHRLACAITQAAQAPGWVSFGGERALVVFVTRLPGAQRLEVSQAGCILYRRSLPQGPGGDLRISLPDTVRRETRIDIRLNGMPLLGSGLQLSIVGRVEAVALSPSKRRLRGYAWMPGAPDLKPSLVLRVAGRPDSRFTVTGARKFLTGQQFSEGRRFSVPLPAGGGPVHILGPDGRDVSGSPVYPTSVAAPCLPPARSGLDVIIPVIRGAADLRDCLRSLSGNLPDDTRIVVVDDGSTDQALLDLLAKRQAAGQITLLRHAQNRGYPGAINTGLRHAAGRDALLLNSDTLVPPGTIARLAKAAYSALDIGSVTPLSNEASILSYPSADGGNEAPRGAALRAIDRLCQAVNRGRVIDLPTAVGFCMYVRADCMAACGGFREDLFAQGYGEENEWCRRSAALGWRHVAAADVFVAHLGGRSFGAARSALLARNNSILNVQHPGYDALIQRFLRQDPLAAMRRDLDMARWRRAGSGPSVLLISHDGGGGVARFLQDRCDELRTTGYQPLVLAPDGEDRVVVQTGDEDAYPNLRFRCDDEMPVLLAWLRRRRIEWVELHHLLGHPPGMEMLARRLRVPLDIVVHDHMFICPRITLVGRGDRYCGEPVDTVVCDACVAELGSAVPDGPPVAVLRARSASLFATARQVIVPCQDVARRVRRHTKAMPLVRPWQHDAALPPRLPLPPGRLRVAVVGAINEEKGLGVLRDCARTARDRALPIEFVLIGFSSDDDMLLDAGVFVTGKFSPDEAQSLLRRERAGIGFLPSIKPETWCYALTTMWEAGLDVLSFDIGAQAERTRATGRGRLLPFGVSPDRVLTTLIAMQSARTG